MASRGLYEALGDYVKSCKKGDGLRVAAYEFHYKPFLELLKDAKKKNGVDVQVVYDDRKDKPGKTNRAAIKAVGIGPMCTRNRSKPATGGRITSAIPSAPTPAILRTELIGGWLSSPPRLRA